MSDDTYIQLPADGTGQRVRVLELTEPNTDGETLVVQEAVVLADRNGNLIGVVQGDSLKSSDRVTQDLLRGLLLRLDILNAAIVRGYEPPDNL